MRTIPGGRLSQEGHSSLESDRSIAGKKEKKMRRDVIPILQPPKRGMFDYAKASPKSHGKSPK